ncbi:MAG: site-2 protease family protein [Ruminococcaceae bacterium]|nr:site-2 protease family protein [Oscillospiraceae bacterium]
MTVFYILLAILLFGVLILVHEFGHFITAKLSGVQVNEFSLFMGPAIWKKQKGETLYALRCIPIGGYCAMEGEDGDSDNPRAFANAKVWKRMIILVAGAAMNLIIGFIMVVIFVGFYYGEAEVLPTKQISAIEDGRPFANVLQVGDEFYEINDRRVFVKSDITMLLDREEDGVHDIVVIRDGEKVKLNDVTMKRDYQGENGLLYGFSCALEECDVGSVLSYSVDQSLDFGRLVWMSLGDLVSGRASMKDMGGPVMIVETVTQAGVQSETVGLGILNVIYFFAFIAINLAVMNLLPIPALDGGRVVCLIVTAVAEKILRRKIDPKYEGYLHAGFMMLLLALMAFITFKDVIGLFN